VTWAPATPGGLHIGGAWREIGVHLQAPSDFDQTATALTVKAGGGAHERAIAYASASVTAATLAATQPVRALIPRSVCRASQFLPSVQIRHAAASWFVFGLSLVYTGERQRFSRST
jgi:hypothetical protein